MFRHVLMLAVVVLLLAPSHADAQNRVITKTDPATPPAPPPPKTELVKFVELKELRAGVNKKYALKFMQLGTNKTMEFPVELETTTRDFDDLRDMKNGEYVTIDISRLEGGKFAVTAAEAYSLKPGEEEDDVYLFYDVIEQKIGTQNKAVLRVSKLGQRTLFVLPSTVNRSGRPEVKEEFKEFLDGLSDGDSIVISAGPGQPRTVKAVSAYEPPDVGTFVKLRDITDEKKNRTTVVIISDLGNKEHTFGLLPAKKAAVLAKLKPVKEDTLVQYRITTDDKGTWLVDIKAAPRGSSLTIPKVPDAKSDAKPDAKTDDKADAKPTTRPARDSDGMLKL